MASIKSDVQLPVQKINLRPIVDALLDAVEAEYPGVAFGADINIDDDLVLTITPAPEPKPEQQLLM